MFLVCVVLVCAVPLCGYSCTGELCPSTSGTPTPTADPKNGRGGGAQPVSISGSILGACTFVVLVSLATVAVTYVVVKYRRNRTETLGPWPETKGSDRAIHNPTYGAKEFSCSPPSHSPSPLPVYEDVQSPTSIDASDTDSTVEYVVNNPLYGDVSYSPVQLTNASPTTGKQVSLYAYAMGPEGKAEIVYEDQSTSVESANGVVTSKPQNHSSSQDPPTESQSGGKQLDEARDSLDYSTLDPATSYASLEPYMGNQPPPVPKHKSKARNAPQANKITAADPEDYSHLSH